MLINHFKSIKDSTVSYSQELSKVLNIIKSDQSHLNKISLIRFYKEQKEIEEYKFQKSRLPLVCFNFTFKNKKRNEEIIASTGLIYIDIDKPYDINLIDKTKVYSYWSSVGNNGWGLLVKCQNVTLENFKTTYLNIIKELKLEEVYDIGARKATQPCYISADPNLFLNEDCFVFNSSTIEIEKRNKNLIKAKTDYILKTVKSTELEIYSNRPTNEELRLMPQWSDKLMGCYFKETKYPIIEVTFPFKSVNISKRNYTLNAMFHTFLWLNEIYTKHNFTKEFYVNKLIEFNNIICQTPLTINECHKIIYKKLEYLEKGTLSQPKPHKLRTYLFDTEKITKKRCGNNLLRESNNTRELINLYTKLNNNNMLDECIVNWDFINDGIISQSKISKKIGLSIVSISKRWPNYKDTIEMLNKENESLIKMYKENKIKTKKL